MLKYNWYFIIYKRSIQFLNQPPPKSFYSINFSASYVASSAGAGVATAPPKRADKSSPPPPPPKSALASSY